MSEPKRIAVERVTQDFTGRSGVRLRAVDDVSFTLDSDQASIVSLVGASGSGKSTIARIMLDLQKPTSGRVTYGGTPLDKLNRQEYARYRRDVQPVFQDPYSIFNPFYRVDRVFTKAIKRFGLASNRTDATTLVETALRAVKLDPDTVLGRYPHQLSGGQRQRLMLARLHMLQPSFVVADEPVSMLDAQVRKSFLDIMVDFQCDHGMTTLFVTHDLSTVAYVGGQMMTLYRGKVVESGPVEDGMADPSHQYNKLLLASAPPPDPDQRWTDRIVLGDGEPQLSESTR